MATILSTWDAAVHKLDQLIAQKKQLKKGLMQQLLTGQVRFPEFIPAGGTKYKETKVGRIPEDWGVYKMGKLVKFSGGSQPPRSTFVFKPKEGYVRLIQTRDFKTDKFKTYIPAKDARKTFNNTDIMIGRYGPPLFQLFKGLQGAYNVALIKAIPNAKFLNKDFVWYYLNRPELQKFLELLSQRTGGQTGIEMDRLKSYPLPVPFLAEQQKIAEILIAVDQEIETLEQQKHHLQLQKKGLMQQLLTGAIRVKTD